MNALMTVSAMAGGRRRGLGCSGDQPPGGGAGCGHSVHLRVRCGAEDARAGTSPYRGAPLLFGHACGRALRALRTLPTIRWLILVPDGRRRSRSLRNFVFLQPFLGEYGDTPSPSSASWSSQSNSRESAALLCRTGSWLRLGLRRLLVTALGLSVAGMLVIGLGATHHRVRRPGTGDGDVVRYGARGADSYIHNRVSSSVRATVMSVMPLGMALLFAIGVPLLGVCRGRAPRARLRRDRGVLRRGRRNVPASVALRRPGASRTRASRRLWTSPSPRRADSAGRPLL